MGRAPGRQTVCPDRWGRESGLPRGRWRGPHKHFDSAVAAYFVTPHPFSLDMPEEGCFYVNVNGTPEAQGIGSFFRGFRVLEIFIGLFPYKLITLSFTSGE